MRPDAEAPFLAADEVGVGIFYGEVVDRGDFSGVGDRIQAARRPVMRAQHVADAEVPGRDPAAINDVEGVLRRRPYAPPPDAQLHDRRHADERVQDWLRLDG